MKRRAPTIKPRLWTEADIYTLRQMAGKASRDEIAAALGRTVGAVAVKAGYLGISLIRYGELHQTAKYSDADIETMRDLDLDGVPRREIAARFPHIPRPYVYALVRYCTRLGGVSQ